MNAKVVHKSTTCVVRQNCCICLNHIRLQIRTANKILCKIITFYCREMSQRTNLRFLWDFFSPTHMQSSFGNTHIWVRLIIFLVFLSKSSFYLFFLHSIRFSWENQPFCVIVSTRQKGEKKNKRRNEIPFKVNFGAFFVGRESRLTSSLLDVAHLVCIFVPNGIICEIKIVFRYVSFRIYAIFTSLKTTYETCVCIFKAAAENSTICIAKRIARGSVDNTSSPLFVSHE